MRCSIGSKPVFRGWIAAIGMGVLASWGNAVTAAPAATGAAPVTPVTAATPAAAGGAKADASLRGAAARNARKLIEDGEFCVHLAGEFGGDQSARDRQVAQQMKALKCDRVLSRLAALQRRLPETDALRVRIQEVLSPV